MHMTDSVRHMQVCMLLHIHASEPERWPGYNLVIRAIVKIFKRELLSSKTNDNCMITVNE